MLGSFGPVPIVHACLRTGTRQDKSRTCRQTCSSLIAEGRIAASFRCLLNPAVIQKRNLGTPIPRPQRPPSEQRFAHAAIRRFTNSNVGFKVSATALSQCLEVIKHLLVFARKMKDQMSSRLIISPTFDLHLAHLQPCTLIRKSCGTHLTKLFAHVHRVSLDLGSWENTGVAGASCTSAAVPLPAFDMVTVGSFTSERNFHRNVGLTLHVVR